MQLLLYIYAIKYGLWYCVTYFLILKITNSLTALSGFARHSSRAILHNSEFQRLKFFRTEDRKINATASCMVDTRISAFEPAWCPASAQTFEQPTVIFTMPLSLLGSINSGFNHQLQLDRNDWPMSIESKSCHIAPFEFQQQVHGSHTKQKFFWIVVARHNLSRRLAKCNDGVKNFALHFYFSILWSTLESITL